MKNTLSYYGALITSLKATVYKVIMPVYNAGILAIEYFITLTIFFL